MKTGKLVGNDFAQYIVDAVESDRELYNQRYRPIVKNYAKMRLAGTYDPQKAVKGVLPLAEDGINKFKSEAERYYETKFGVVPGTIKVKIAVELLAGMQGEINDIVREKSKSKSVGNFSKLTTKKEKTTKSPKRVGKFGNPAVWERETTPSTHTTTWRNKNTGAKVSVEKSKNAGGYPGYAINKEGHGMSGFTITDKKQTVKKDIKQFMRAWEK